MLQPLSVYPTLVRIVYREGLRLGVRLCLQSEFQRTCIFLIRTNFKNTYVTVASEKEMINSKEENTNRASSSVTYPTYGADPATRVDRDRQRVVWVSSYSGYL
jgi:hypothetical protein